MDHQDVVIAMDGRVLHGGQWIKPVDFAEAEVERGELPSLKGASPIALPQLEADQEGEIDGIQ